MSVDNGADKRKSSVRWIWLAVAAAVLVVLLALGGLFLLLLPLIYPEHLSQPSQQDKISNILVEPPPPPPPPPPASSPQKPPDNVIGGLFGSQTPAHTKPAHPKRVSLSSAVAASLLIQKSVPMYPPIARAARISGTVVLHAVISTSGSVKDLHVVSGPIMLQQSALDAVKNWKYRPYLFNNQPVEFEITVNVVYTLSD